MRLFASFGEAWRWFVDGGELVPLAAQRERFAAGRAQYLSFQAPLRADDAAQAAADDLLDALRDVPDLLPLDAELRHVSIKSAGFQVIRKTREDEVLREDVPRIAERAARVLKDAARVPVRIGLANVFPDALVLEVHDGGVLGEIRRALAAVVAAEAERIGEDRYLPHVTVASFASAEAGRALRERLPAIRDALAPVETTIRRIELARYWFTGLDVEDEELDVDVIRTYRLA